MTGRQTPAYAGWVAPLGGALLPDLTARHVERLGGLEGALVEALAESADVADWSTRLLTVRRTLAGVSPFPAAAPGAAAALGVLAGFVCGFHDLDLRDAVGPGHGRMILRYGSPSLRRRWARRMGAGALVGIAATERHGGSRLPEITTRLVRKGDGLRLDGEKCWVSRLMEASAFVVFAKDDDGAIQAVVVTPDTPGVVRRPERPSGLAGWAWGTVSFNGVRVSEGHVLASSGGGARIFREHFAAFRPLVAATALGTAAGVHSRVLDTLTARTRTGIVPRLRDTALVALGRTHAELSAALVSAVVSARLTAEDSESADVWSRGVKAHGVETALRAVQDLAPLVGAGGFRADSPIAKARADLTGLLYADGIHDALYRSIGRSLTT